MFTTTYVHGGVDLADGFVVCWELIYLDAVAHQLAHNLDFEFVEFALGDGISFGNDGNDADLGGGGGRDDYKCGGGAAQK